MNIAVFLSSPRAGGNSDKLATSFIEGAQHAGHMVTTFAIRDLNINGCLGCEYCYSHNGDCIQQDDMQTVYAALESTNLIVFATPIYYQGFPSQLKAVVDRLYVTENRDFAISKSILLATYASSGSAMATQTLAYYHCLSDYHEWKNIGEIAVSDLDERDDILGNSALLQAYELGLNLEKKK